MYYTFVDKIATVRVLCQKVLPTSYGESLSYMEQIAKLAYKVNETIEATNALNDNVQVLNDAVTDLSVRLVAVEGEIDSFEKEVRESFARLEESTNAKVNAAIDSMNARADAIEAQQTQFEVYITSKIEALEKSFTDILNTEIAYLNEMYTQLAIDLRRYIEEKVNEAISDIPDLTNIFVIDPTTGNLSKVQDAIHNMFYYVLSEALTIDEFNKLNLTVDELNGLMVDSLPIGFTIDQWLTKARTWLVKRLDIARVEFLAYPHSAVWDYLRGLRVWHDRNVDVNQMLIQIAGSYSCGELNTLSITHGQIEEANVSCVDYALYANTILA